MKSIAQEELHPLLLDVLSAFHAYCEHYKLTYFLSDGTLLGAVRHQGFIPWDDDVDVSMVDAEYDRLIEIAKQNPYLDASGRYKFLLPTELPNFYPFLKVVDTATVVYEKDIDQQYAIGLWLDVFRLSHCDADFSLTLKKYRRIKLLRTINKLVVAGNFSTPLYQKISPIVRVAKALASALGFRCPSLSQKMVEIEGTMPSEGARLMDITWADNDRHFFDARLWEETTELEFCGRKFSAPRSYEGILSEQFGNYMQLPPVKDRIRHAYEAYYI